MTFLEAYILLGPDVELIAELLCISPHQADRLINRELDRRYVERRRQAEAKRSA